MLKKRLEFGLVLRVGRVRCSDQVSASISISTIDNLILFVLYMAMLGQMDLRIFLGTEGKKGF
jgi:hypothetical protein